MTEIYYRVYEIYEGEEGDCLDSFDTFEEAQEFADKNAPAHVVKCVYRAERDDWDTEKIYTTEEE